MLGKTIKKVLCLLLALTFVLSLFSACSGTKGGNQTQSAAATTAATATTAADGSTSETKAVTPGWKEDTSPVTIDWYVNMSWYGAKWDTENAKYITEKTGVNLNIIVPTGNEAEKLNTMIASNTLPDVITLGWNDLAVKRLEDSGMVYALNDLAKEQDPYFLEVASKSTIGWYTRENGNIYGYPNFSVGPDRLTSDVKVGSNQTFLVRKDIYEAIGKPDMRTQEGFLNALKAAKEKFPNVNGKPLIPLALGMEFNEKGAWELDEILANFLAVPLEKDGKICDRLQDPEYLNWLKTLRKASEMGLLSTEIFIDKRLQMKEKAIQGRYFAILAQYVDLSDATPILYQSKPEQAYIAIDGPANSKMDKPVLRGPGITGWTLNMISKSSKNAARTMKFFSYWISEEGQKDFFLGKEGVTRETIDGVDQVKADIIEKSKTDSELISKVLGIQDSYWMLIDELAFQKYMPKKVEPLLQNELWTKEQPKASFGALDDVNPPAESDEGVAGARIQEMWGAIQPKLLLAKSDEEFDAILKKYLDDRAKAGYDKLMEYKNKKFLENKKKLGLN